MAKYLDSAGLTHLVSKLKSDVIPNVKVNAAKEADSVPASGITGVIDIKNIPKGALERVVTVADDTARYKLTTSQVQLGDTVKVTSSGRMYIVVDESKLSSSAGYMEYAAGTAASVPWSGVTGKPSSFTPATHQHTVNLTLGKASAKAASTSGTTAWTLAEILGSAPTTSGSGNAITAISVSGNTITATKGTTFATGTQLSALDGRVSELEAFTGTGGADGGLAESLNAAGYDIVLFEGFLKTAPTTQNTGISTADSYVAVLSTSQTPGGYTIDRWYAKKDDKYYTDWSDSVKVTPDKTGFSTLHKHKLYIDTSTSKAYYALTEKMLWPLNGGDTALTDDEINAAIAKA